MLEPFSAALHAEKPGANGSQPAAAAAETAEGIQIVDEDPTSSSPLLALDAVTLRSPDGSTTLVQDLSLQVSMQPSQGSCPVQPASPLGHSRAWFRLRCHGRCAARVRLVTLEADTASPFGACLCQQQSGEYTAYVTLSTGFRASQVPLLLWMAGAPGRDAADSGPFRRGKNLHSARHSRAVDQRLGHHSQVKIYSISNIPAIQSYELASTQGRYFHGSWWTWPAAFQHLIFSCLSARYGQPVTAGSRSGDIFFVPQRPYVVLGTLREQLLYPTWSVSAEEATAADTSRQATESNACAVSKRMAMANCYICRSQPTLPSHPCGVQQACSETL